MTDPRLQGVVPIVEVPFTDEGAIDDEGFANVVERLLERDMRTLMFPGFASEFYKLTERERLRLEGVLLDATAGADGAIAVISVSDHATVNAVHRARDAVDRGAGAINVLPPHFLSPSTADVIDHVDAILAAIASTPVTIQLAPAQTGGSLPVGAIKELRGRHANLQMVKVEAQPPGRIVSALLAEPNPIASAVGYAGLTMIEALSRGAVGVQPGCSFVEIYEQIWQAWISDDRQAAESLHARLLPYVTRWMQSVELIIAVEKLVSKERGWIRSAHCRRPAWLLDDVEKQHVHAFLAEFADVLLT